MSQSAAESSLLPTQAQLMLIGVKLSNILVAVAINNGKSAMFYNGMFTRSSKRLANFQLDA